jgi:Rod binding domain-containing protein
VTAPVEALVARARAAADEKSVSNSSATTDRQHLLRLASEFESMLLNQMLQEMRRAGRWDDGKGDGESEGTGFGGTGALFEILDAELSKQLSQAQGVGLSRQLMEALDRLQGVSPEPGQRRSAAATVIPPPRRQPKGPRGSNCQPRCRQPAGM